MRKYFIKIALLFSIIIILTNCKKIGKTHHVYFYTDINTSKESLALFVDKKNKGILPYINVVTSALNDTVISNTLHFSLRSGKYNLEVKDVNGNIKYLGTLKIRSNSIATTSSKGFNTLSFSDEKIVMKLNY